MSKKLTTPRTAFFAAAHDTEAILQGQGRLTMVAITFNSGLGLAEQVARVQVDHTELVHRSFTETGLLLDGVRYRCPEFKWFSDSLHIVRRALNEMSMPHGVLDHLPQIRSIARGLARDAERLPSAQDAAEELRGIAKTLALGEGELFSSLQFHLFALAHMMDIAAKHGAEAASAANEMKAA